MGMNQAAHRSIEFAGESISADTAARLTAELMTTIAPEKAYSMLAEFLLYLQAREESGGAHSRRVYGNALDSCLTVLELTRESL